MIDALRRRHRSLIFAAAIACPVILFAALSGRTPAQTDTTPLIARNIPAPGPVLIGEHTLRLLPGAQDAWVNATVHSEASSPSPWTLTLTDAGQHSPGPDVLIYWQQDGASGQLAGDAVLLGPYLGQRENRFELPVGSATGSVVFYSLAHQQVLGAVPLPTIVEGS